MSDNKTPKFRIYPSIGVARVGNGPACKDKVVWSPEVPGEGMYATDLELYTTEGRCCSTEGDSVEEGQLKKMAQRFYVYECDAEGKPVKPISADDYHIKWKVEVANKKPFWYKFNNCLDLSIVSKNEDVSPNVALNKLAPGGSTTYRNPNVLNMGERDDGYNYREELVNRVPAVSVDRHTHKRHLNGSFPFVPDSDGTSRLARSMGCEDQSVRLGTIEYDDGKYPDGAEDKPHYRGTLIFYAGDGVSASLNPSDLNTDFADNSNWYDDICDGRVTATLTPKNGGKKDAVTLDDPSSAAWIVTAPPNYAPQIDPLSTMFDLITGAAEAKERYFEPGLSLVIPLMYRLYRMQWVNLGDFLAPSFRETIDELAAQGKLKYLYTKYPAVETAEAVEVVEVTKVVKGAGAVEVSEAVEVVEVTKVVKRVQGVGTVEVTEAIEAAHVRERIFKMFRNPAYPYTNQPIIPSKQQTDIKNRGVGTDTLQWPYYPSDGVDYPGSPAQWFAIPPVLYKQLENWCNGEFESIPDLEGDTMDQLGEFFQKCYKKAAEEPGKKALLMTRAVLETLYGGGFHPGVELTWPMRHNDLYAENKLVYRNVTDRDGHSIGLYGLREVRVNAASPEQEEQIFFRDFGYQMNSEDIRESLKPGNSKNWLWQITPGDLTKWMGIPWQSDAGSCQAVFTEEQYPVPAWWAANLPVYVLTQESFEKLKNPDILDETKRYIYGNRLPWLHTADLGFVGYHAEGGYTKGLIDMVYQWDKLGAVVGRKFDGDVDGIPNLLYVAYTARDAVESKS